MTRSMIRWMLAGCMGLTALGAVAVLDIGSPTAEAEPSVSPFAGSWSGKWSVFDVEVVGTGTFDWAISSAGQLKGRVNDPGEDGGAIVGHVGDDGTLSFVGFAPADIPTTGSGVPFHGTAVIDGDGKLVVSVTRTDSKIRSLVAVLERN